MNPQAPAAESLSSSDAPVSPVEINRSCGLPVTLLLAASVFWLVVAGVLGLISAIKLHAAGFLASPPWLTYGRVYPAYTNALVYGFASQAGLGLALWIVARLSRTALWGPFAATIAGVFWNAGVSLGIAGILAGDSTGYIWLEQPGYATPVLFISYSVLALCAVITFHSRRERQLYVSVWYLVAALFWFPWIYSTAQLLLVFFPARGVVQAVINGWFAHNLFGIWLTFLGLASIFYFLPKILGRPLHSHDLALFGFWSLAFFGCWGGVSAGTPAPSWLGSVSIVAGGMTLLPVLAVAVNWHKTMSGQGRKLGPNPILPFLKVGAFCYVVGSLLTLASLVHAPGDFSAEPRDVSEAMQWPFVVLSGLVSQINEITQFTYFQSGLTALFLYGFFAMAALGGIYDVVPRLTQREWPFPSLVKFHFRSASAGVALAVLPLLAGGLRQGGALNNPSVLPVDVVRGTIPFLGVSTLGMLLLLMGNAALGVNLVRLLVRCGCSRCCPSSMPATSRRAPAALGASL